ncbi:MAG: HDOD domain-containing protein [Nitrospiraceae bacterium]
MSSPRTAGPTAYEPIEQALIERIGNEKIELPLLPNVATQILALVNNPDSDAAKLAGLIHRDQALAAHVLRIANSPAYMPRTPIVSLQHAVSMLGMTLLSEIALTVSLKAGTFVAPGHDRRMQFLWKHSLASGVYAKEVAKLKRLNMESAYVCGLLHAVGKPVVLNSCVGLSAELKIPLEPDLLDEVIEAHHVALGMQLADKWQLPKQARESITHYRQYDQAESFKQEVMMTCVADRLATFLLDPALMDEASLRKHQAFAALNLYPKDLDALVAAKDKVEMVVASLSL